MFFKPAIKVKNLGEKSLAGLIELERVYEKAHVFIMMMKPTKRLAKPCETGAFRLSVIEKYTMTQIHEAITC